MSKVLTYSPLNAIERPIKNGSRYDIFFGETEDKRTLLKKNLSTRETVLAMIDIINSKSNQTREIAKYLAKESLVETCRNIWNFCFDYIKYQQDIEEELREPNATWRDGQIMARQYPNIVREDGVQHGVDCDCYSIFIGSILSNLDIPFNLKMTSYLDTLGFDNGFQHVYIIVPLIKESYITIDPVVHSFNYEKPVSRYELFTLSKKIHSDMAKVYVLSGFDNEKRQNYDDSLIDLMTGRNIGGLNLSGYDDNAVLEYLKSTRTAVISNPSIILNQNPDDFVRMLDLCIKYWYIPEKRDDVLEQLAQLENHLIRTKDLKLKGFDFDSSELSGGFFSKLKENISENRAERQDKKATQEKGTVLNKLNRFNPATIPVRNAFRALIGINFLGLATILASDDEKAKAVKTKVENMYFSLGGKKDTLNKTIENGKTRKPLLNKNAKDKIEVENLGYLGEPFTVAAIAATASAPVATTVKWMKDAGIFKEGTAAKALETITSVETNSVTATSSAKEKKGFLSKWKEKRDAKKTAQKAVVDSGTFDEKDANKDGKVSFLEKLAKKAKTVSDNTDTKTVTDTTTGDKTENQLNEFSETGDTPDTDENSLKRTLGKLVKEHPFAFALGTTAVAGGIALAFPQVREWAGISTNAKTKKLGLVPLS